VKVRVSLTNQVFEYRNKAYGAYPIRKEAPGILLKSFVYAVGGLFAFLMILLAINEIGNAEAVMKAMESGNNAGMVNGEKMNANSAVNACVFSKDRQVPLILSTDHDAIPVNLEEISASIQFQAAADVRFIGGKALFRIWVDENGNTMLHKLEETNHAGFAAECEKHLPKLKFRPARRKGNPVSSTALIPFRL